MLKRLVRFDTSEEGFVFDCYEEGLLAVADSPLVSFGERHGDQAKIHVVHLVQQLLVLLGWHIEPRQVVVLYAYWRGQCRVLESHLIDAVDRNWFNSLARGFSERARLHCIP